MNIEDESDMQAIYLKQTFGKNYSKQNSGLYFEEKVSQDGTFPQS